MFMFPSFCFLFSISWVHTLIRLVLTWILQSFLFQDCLGLNDRVSIHSSLIFISNNSCGSLFFGFGLDRVFTDCSQHCSLQFLPIFYDKPCLRACPVLNLDILPLICCVAVRSHYCACLICLFFPVTIII